MPSLFILTMFFSKVVTGSSYVEPAKKVTPAKKSKWSVTEKVNESKPETVSAESESRIDSFLNARKPDPS